MTTELERDFAAWADRADPEALTRVFDATAGRLLLLAAHVTGAHASAEDLVQATFLAAMRSCATWDRAAAVWPWLAAILQNEARMVWRRQQRRREVGLEVAASVAAEERDPAQLAAAEEQFAQLVGAIDALPLHYRQILRLRLVHGLRQVDIARALELPVGTVRARTHRGLARLRAALPAATAVSVGALLVGDGALLAQVRARVLEEAGAMHGAAAGGVATVLVTGGWWAMHGKTWAWVGAVAAMLLVVGFAIRVSPDLGAGASAGVPPPMIADAHASAAATPGEDVQAQRTPIERDAGAAWPLIATVKTLAGKPIVGARVTVSTVPKGVENLPGREVVATGETESDGTFRCSLDALRQRSVLFRCMHFLHVDAVSESTLYNSPSTLLLPRTDEPRTFTANLVLGRAIDIVGRVVDANGLPVAGAHLDWLHQGRVVELRANADVDGAFHVAAEPSWFGTQPDGIVATEPARGLGFVELPRLAEPPLIGTTVDIGAIALEARSSIRGRVVLGDGSGLGQFPLEVRTVDPALVADPRGVERELSEYRGKNRWPLQFEGGRLVRSQVQTITGSDGSFCCSGLDPSAVYAVAVRDTAMRWIAAVARPDGDAVHLVVDRQFVRLDVQGGSGDALVGANVAAEGYDPASRYPIDKIRPGFPATGPSVIARFYPADAQGRRLLLSPFGWVWRIGSFDEIAQADFLRHEALAGVYRVDLQLRLRAETHFGSLQVEVVDEQGRPFRPFNVVLQCLDKDAGRQSSSQSLDADHMLSDLPAGRWQLTVRAGAEVFFGGYCYARGSHVREIQIGDQQTTKVRVEAPVAGLATFRLRSNPAPAPLNWGEFALRSEPGGVALPCFPCEPFTRAAGPVGKAVGEDLLYIAEQAFPPGRHTFVVEAKGYQPARCEVEIVADRCVEAVVDLVRQ